MRPLAAALCLGEGEFVLTGEERMFERPIGDLVDALLPLVRMSTTWVTKIFHQKSKQPS